MDNAGSNGVNGNINQQRKEKAKCKFKCTFMLIDRLSMFCTFVAVSIFCAIFFDLTDILDYRNVNLIRDWAYYLVIAATIFYFLALIMSQFIKQDSQSTKAIILNTRKGRVVIENSPTRNVSPENSKSTTDKLKYTKGIKEMKQDAFNNNVKPINTTSGTPSHAGTSKQNKIELNTLPTNSSCKTLQKTSTFKQGELGEKTSPPGISSKNLKDDGPLRKADKSTKALVIDTPFKVQKRTGPSKQGEIEAETFSSKTKSLNINEKFRHNDKQNVPFKRQIERPSSAKKIPAVSSSPAPYCEDFLQSTAYGNRPATERISSRSPTNTLSEIQQHAGPSEHGEFGAKSLNVYEKLWRDDEQRNPFENKIKSPISMRNMPIFFPYPAPYFQDFIPPNALGYFPATTMTAKKVRTNYQSGIPQYAGQSNQGEIDDGTFSFQAESLYFNDNFQHADQQLVHFQNPLPANNTPRYFPTPSPSFQNLTSTNASENVQTTDMVATENVSIFPGGVTHTHEEYRVRKTTLFQYPRNEVFSPCISRPIRECDSNNISTMFSTLLEEPRVNEVSDVETRFKSMNFSQ